MPVVKHHFQPALSSLTRKCITSIVRLLAQLLSIETKPNVIPACPAISSLLEMAMDNSDATSYICSIIDYYLRTKVPMIKSVINQGLMNKLVAVLADPPNFKTLDCSAIILGATQKILEEDVPSFSQMDIFVSLGLITSLKRVLDKDPKNSPKVLAILLVLISASSKYTKHIIDEQIVPALVRMPLEVS